MAVELYAATTRTLQPYCRGEHFSEDVASQFRRIFEQNAQERSALLAHIGRLYAQIETLKDQLTESEEQRAQEGQASYRALRLAEDTNRQLRSRISELEESEQKSASLITDLRGQLDLLRSEIGTLNRQLMLALQRLEKGKGENRALNREIKGLNNLKINFLAQIQLQEQQIAVYTREYNELIQKCHRLERENTHLAERAQVAEQRNVELTQKVEMMIEPPKRVDPNSWTARWYGFRRAVTFYIHEPDPFIDYEYKRQKKLNPNVNYSHVRFQVIWGDSCRVVMR